MSQLIDIPARKSEKEIKNTIVTNIFKMFIDRKYIDKGDWKNFDDHIRKYINIQSDDVYVLKLDRPLPFPPGNYDGSKIIIKLFIDKILDSFKSSFLTDFISEYDKFHKIVVYGSVSEKVYNNMKKMFDIEIFETYELMLNLSSVVCAPLSYEIIDPSDKDYKYCKNMATKLITQNDKAAKHYNLKKGDVVRIVSPHASNVESLCYRTVV